jgi:tetratricopeptide (TPR) repeat protein
VRIETEENRSRLKWIEAYRTVFGEEPNGPLAEARMRAALNFYSPERSVGRRQALEAVRASEEEAASRTREAERVFEANEPDDPLLGRAGPVHRTDEEPEGEWLPLPSEDALTLGAALMKIGRLEAEVEELRRAVARLEAGLHRSETRLGGMAPGLRALREAVREARDLALKVSHRVDALAPASSSEDKSLPPRKELRELRARMDEERGRILLEVENRLEEAEELIRRSTENRIAALESWVRRVSRYLGIGKKGGLFR